MKTQKNLWNAIEKTVSEENTAQSERLKKEVKSLDEEILKIADQPVTEKKQQIEKSFYGFTTLVEVEEKIDQSKIIAEVIFDKQKIRKTKERELQKRRVFTQSQIDFAAKFQPYGLQPMAVLPASLWDALLEKFGLYRFENIQENGKVEIKTINGNWFILICLVLMSAVGVILPATIGIFALKGSILTLFLLIVTGFCFLLGIGCLFEKKWMGVLPLVISLILFGGAVRTTSLPFDAKSMFANFFVFSIVFFVTVTVTFGPKEGKLYEIPTKALLKIFHKLMIRLLSHKFLLKNLWPERTDVIGKKDSDDEYSQITVRFPKAPEYFLETLIKLKNAGFQPMIAAVPEAIVVSRKEISETRLKEIEKMQLEPILYFKENGQVAVFDCFGNFPKEEKVIEWVKKEGLKLCFN